MRLHLCLLLACVSQLAAAVVVEPVRTEFDGKTFVGEVLYDSAWTDARPGVLVVHNWMGPTPENRAQAQLIVERFGYVAYLCDVYGEGVRPNNPDEAGAAAGALKADRATLGARALQQLSAFRDLAGSVPLDPSRISAVGFCFGGTTVLEMARQGADIKAAISFHGGLDFPEPWPASVAPRLWILHGDADPFVPAEQVAACLAQLRAANADFEFVSYAKAVHSFSDPGAAWPGKAEYFPRVAARAWANCGVALAEVFSE